MKSAPAPAIVGGLSLGGYMFRWRSNSSASGTGCGR